MSSSFHPEAPQPVADAAFSERITSLDVLRGAAVLFALFTSIWFFGGFSGNDRTGLLVNSKGAGYRLLGFVDILLDGKMRALIAMIFGAGMILLLRKPNASAGLSTHELFIRRQMWLILFGVINGLFFFWTRDVLFHLGIMGILLFPFARLKVRGLLIAAVVTTLIYSAKNYWSYADDRGTYSKYKVVAAAEDRIKKDSATRSKALVVKGIKDSTIKKDTLTKKQAADKGSWEGLVSGKKYDPKKDEGEKKKMRSTSYESLYDHLMPTLQVREAQWTYRYGIWDLASAIFLGMALFKLGFFSRGGSRYTLIGLAAITAGILLAWYRLHNEQLMLKDYARFIDGHALPNNIFFPFERLLIAFGYASFTIGLLQVKGLQFLWRSFAAVGKLALTNYLLQSLICVFLFTGFGAGYYGRLPQYQLYLLALEILVVQVVFSSFWLKRYNTGPAEWLWRCLLYGKRLPFSKKTTGIQPTTPSFTDI